MNSSVRSSCSCFSRCLFSIISAAIIASTVGCSPNKNIEAIFPLAFQPRDPAIEENWVQSCTDHMMFANFVRHAERSPEWLLLDWRGEAIFVRPADPANRKVTFVGTTNKIRTLSVKGGVEALSMRRYTRGESLDFNLETSRLEFGGAEIRSRTNPRFAVPDLKKS